MNIMDGFWLWVGKVLAELAIFGGFMLLLVVGFFAFVFAVTWIDRFKRWKKARNKATQTRGES